MGDLAADTVLAGERGRYRAHLSEDWKIWGPNGGYLAAIALRAAGAAAQERFANLRRPATFSCQFLTVADFRDVELTVEALRVSRRAGAFRVSMHQGPAPVVEAQAWIVDEHREGLQHVASRMPEVPPPEAVPSYDDRQRPEDGPPHPFWSNLETREITWQPRERRRPDQPRWTAWLRFRPQPTFEDPFVDAGRVLLLLDTMCWPAAVKPYADGTLTHLAPSLDISAQFHALAPDASWLLCDTQAPIAAHGLIGGFSQVWSLDGRLLASGGQQMLCRPLPNPQ